MMEQCLADHLLGAEAEDVADATEQGCPDQRRDGVEDDEAWYRNAGETGRDAADQAQTVDITVGQNENVATRPGGTRG
jgi:hypothetical protein